MKRLIVALMMTMLASTAWAQIQLPGVSKELSNMVMDNKILYTDALDITRALNGIDITQRGNNSGPMSEAGKRVLRQMMAERDKAAAPAPAVRGKAARAKAKAKERAQKNSEGRAMLKENGVDLDALEQMPSNDPATAKRKMMAMNDVQIKLAGVGMKAVEVLPLEDVKRLRETYREVVTRQSKVQVDDQDVKMSTDRLVKALKEHISRLDEEIAKRTAQKPTP